MTAAIVVTVSPVRLSCGQGGECRAELTVKNRSEEMGQYRLTAEGGPAEWLAFEPALLSAFPLQETTSHVVVQVPLASAPAVYHFVLVAQSDARLDLVGRTQLDIEVVGAPAAPQPVRTATLGEAAPAAIPAAAAPSPLSPTGAATPPPVLGASQIEMRAERIPATDPAATERRWRLRLRNAGNVLDTISFNVAGLQRAWVNVDPTELTLNPDEGGEAVLIVTPPAEVPPARYPFTVRAFSHLNMNQRSELALQLEIVGRAGLTLSLSPAEAEAQGERRFQLALTSAPDANRDQLVKLSASDADQACEYLFDPTETLVAARQISLASLIVRPRQLLAPKERRTITFQVVATPDFGAPQTASARLNQIGPAPLSLSLKPKIVTADLQADYALTIVNPASVPVTLRLSSEDPEAACSFTFQPSEITIPAAGEALVTLRAQARTYLDGDAQKSHSFTVYAARSGETIPIAQTDGTLIQRASPSLRLVLVPPQLSRPGKAEFSVVASNARPVPAQVWLEARDEDDAIAFQVSPTMISLSPGGEARAVLVARPKDRLRAGDQRRIHRFTVTGRSAGSAAPVTTAGVLAQTKGVDWGSGLVGVAKWLIWLLKWAFFVAVLLFFLSIGASAINEAACRNPRAGVVLIPAMRQAPISWLVSTPAARPAREFVQLMVRVVGAFTDLPPSYCQ
jgi:hypothetical protein